MFRHHLGFLGFLIGLVAVVLALSSVQPAASDPDPQPTIQFSAYADNPVISRGSVENWGGDCGTIFAPTAVIHNGTYYLFYTGSCNRQANPAAIGLATSKDGMVWEKSASNPILKPDDEGYDAMCVSGGTPLIETGPDGDTWVLYFAANSQPCAGPGQHIGRATAKDPHGEWTRGPQPVLEAGAPGDWDEGFIMPHTVIRTENGYIMYYSGGSEFLVPLPRLIGMATSPDGIVWTKYNDPATTESRYANSDPVLAVDADGKSQPFAAWAVDVLPTEDGWEMFYSGTCPVEIKQGCPGFIAYATSMDGIHWTTYLSPETLVLTPLTANQKWSEHCLCHPSAIRSENRYTLFYTGCTDEMNDCRIGMATGTILWDK